MASKAKKSLKSYIKNELSRKRKQLKIENKSCRQFMIPNFERDKGIGNLFKDSGMKEGNYYTIPDRKYNRYKVPGHIFTDNIEFSKQPAKKYEVVNEIPQKNCKAAGLSLKESNLKSFDRLPGYPHQSLKPASVEIATILSFVSVSDEYFNEKKKRLSSNFAKVIVSSFVKISS